MTIRNLVIRNMPQRGDSRLSKIIRTAGPSSTTSWHRAGWASPRPTTRWSGTTTSTTMWTGATQPTSPSNTVFEGNEIAYNTGKQKVLGATNITFRNNFVHHNADDGIWYDGTSVGGIVEGNIVEDNGREGISTRGQPQYRHPQQHRPAERQFGHLHLDVARILRLYSNTVVDNFRAIQYFLNCDALGGAASASTSATTARTTTRFACRQPPVPSPMALITCPAARRRRSLRICRG